MADTRKAAKAFTENAFETTLTSVFNSTDVTLSVNSTGNLAGSGPVYIVINPDDAAKREYIFIDGTITSTSMTTSTVDNRFLAGSAASSGIDHSSGDRVRISPMSQHFDDIWNAIGKVVDVDYSSGTAESIKIAGPVDVNNQVLSNVPDPTNPQEPATKAYVDAKDIDDDLNISDGSNTGTVDLDTETLTVQGTTNEIDVGLSGDTFTVSQPDNVTIGNELTVTNQILANNGIQTDSISERNAGSKITINSDIELATGNQAIGFGGGVVNKLINGNFCVWQRGTSFTSNGYTADRWRLSKSGTGTTTVSQQDFTVGQTDVPDNPKHFIRIAKSSGTSSGYNDYIAQRVEGVETFASTQCTLSFYCKSASGNPNIKIQVSQNFGSGGSPSTAVTTDVGTGTTSSGWTKKSFTFTPASISGKTLGTNDEGTTHYFEIRIMIEGAATSSLDISQVQLERGPQASDFVVTDFATERGKALRYYQRYHANGSDQIVASGAITRSDAVDAFVPIAAPMRTDPTFSNSGSLTFYRSTDTLNVPSPGFNHQTGGVNGLGPGTGIFETDFSGQPDGHGGVLVLNNGSSLIADAEL